MGLTHDQIVQREKKKYSSDWIVLTEVTYGNYRFDIFAFNPKTKEIEIVEVEVASQTDQRKLQFAETLGKVKVYRNLREKILPKEFQIYIDALSNAIRMAVLEILHDQGKQGYSELLHLLHFNSAGDSGRFAYHMKLLLNSGLVQKVEGKYGCTLKGDKILAFFRNFET